MDFDIGFLVKFSVIFIAFVILPVWIFNIADISFGLKSAFTLAGGVGVVIALSGRTIGRNH